MSSFRPANSAKLYASPEDVKTLGYRSRSLPAHSARPQVRKSYSLRSPSSTFKPQQVSNVTPYAQPIRNRNKPIGNAPPIPDPDYSLSEGESDNEGGQVEKTVVRVTNNEGSGNSSTSSGSLPHSFSVDEIQKVRTQLKSSKSYPNDFLPGAEDGDNSSSGVSSDQEVPQHSFDTPSDSIQTATATLPRVSQQRATLTRNAVSLAQLPPPIEAESDDRDGEMVVPPPPEFTGGTAASALVEEVLAPPPQFSDNRLVTRVRIVGAVPKSTTGRLHSQ